MNQIQILRLASIAGSFLVGFWLPIRLIGFAPPMALEVAFDLLISFVSIINIYLHFHDVPDNPKKIRSWLKLDLALDLICLMPFSLFAFVLFDTTLSAVLFFNLLTVRHIRHIKPFLDRFHSLQPITYRLVPLIIFLPLLVHLVACGWISLGSGTAGTEEDSVLTYVKAVYWTFTTLTTVGYGDISAKSIGQMLYSCGIQVVGVGVFGFILSNVAGLLARSDAAREHHMDNLDRIETFMRLHRIPNELRTKIRTYYHYMWTNKKGYQDDALLDGLPGKIQSELFLHINRPIIEKVPFLKGADQELIGDLMSELKPRIFIPDEKIFKVDEKGDALYFIQNGHVDILDRQGKKIVTLGEGAFFGEMALISDRPRTATAKAHTFCDIYTLDRQAFDRVTTAYPEFRTHVEDVMKDRKAS
ncbi:MAG: cyclic nucleotide-binding domain-containing protein [Pseudobdellovibrionaceae bacterium]